MSNCPSCNEAHCVNPLRVWSSGRTFAPKCKKCDAEFYAEGGVAGVFIEIAFFIFTFIVGFVQSTLMMVVLVVLGGIISILLNRAFYTLVAVHGK
jgi:hypothetical protein